MHMPSFENSKTKLTVKECIKTVHVLFRTGKWLSRPHMTSKLGPKMDHVCLGFHRETRDTVVQGTYAQV